MLLAEIDGMQLLVWMGVAVIAWRVYMATFRTDDYLRLKEKEHEEWNKVGRAAKTGFSIARWFMKR